MKFVRTVLVVLGTSSADAQSAGRARVRGEVGGLAIALDGGLSAPRGGTLRLSTPNLDWVMLTHYRGATAPDDDARADCLRLNRAFHAWGHQFLYNRAMLVAALRSAGFAETAFRSYGESDRPELRGLERHETWVDTAELPHVLIVEATGVAPPVRMDGQELKEFREAMGSR